MKKLLFQTLFAFLLAILFTFMFGLVGLWPLALAMLLAFYFLPAIIASRRETHNKNGIFLLNALTGWFGIGWLAALAMACGSRSVENKVQ
jgi:hypothetical protein